TDVVAERARRRAAEIDSGRHRGPLVGVPFAVKNLFDSKGLPRRAGSKINLDGPIAAGDASLVRKLEAAGAVLVGGLNMGEYAYDFTGENAHYGPSRNPRDTTRMTGGSSGGSGAAVAAGGEAVSLGSPTNRPRPPAPSPLGPFRVETAPRPLWPPPPPSLLPSLRPPFAPPPPVH